MDKKGEDDNIIVNFYDEASPVKLSRDEQRRIENYVKEQGIISGTIKRFGDYVGIIVGRYRKGSEYERGCEARRAKARDTEHLTCLGSDSLESDNEQGDDYNGRSE